MKPVFESKSGSICQGEDLSEATIPVCGNVGKCQETKSWKDIRLVNETDYTKLSGGCCKHKMWQSFF